MSRFRPRRDTTANWEGVNPPLELKEIGHATDTGLFKVGRGDEWNDTPYYPNDEYEPGGSVVDTTKLLSAQAGLTIDFPNDRDYAGFIVEAKLRSARAGVINDGLQIQLSGDTGSNYQNQQIRAAGTTVTAAENATPATAIAGAGANHILIPAATAPADYFAHIVVKIPFPSMVVGWKDLHIENGRALGTGASDIGLELLYGLRRNTAPITSISFLSTTGSNLIAGCTFKLTTIL